MKTFHQLLAATLIAGTTNNFVWFAVTFWVYLETRSVIATAYISGIYLIATALSSFWFGSIVDHNKKKNTLIGSSAISLIFFSIGFLIYQFVDPSLFKTIGSPMLWVFILVLLLGTIAGNIYNIAVPTLITVLVPADGRDKANGLFGTISGIGFALTSVASGLILGFLGMFWVMVVAVTFTLLALSALFIIKIPEDKVIHIKDSKPKNMDIKGTIKVIAGIPGLFALIFFTTFNNFLGGVFMALMDAYGLTLVSVQVWGLMWGVLSFGFIIGGLFIAKRGLGKNPLKTLFLVNIIMWIICIFFTIQPWIWLTGIGMLIWMCLIPFVEATEQTIIQKVVPLERQGRVFGFAQSVEQAASPITAFMIGPLAELIFIPYMSNGGAGANLIGSWFGVGTGRGIALVFIVSGLIGLTVTLIAMRSNAYKLLSQRYVQ